MPFVLIRIDFWVQVTQRRPSRLKTTEKLLRVFLQEIFVSNHRAFSDFPLSSFQWRGGRGKKRSDDKDP